MQNERKDRQFAFFKISNCFNSLSYQFQFSVLINEFVFDVKNGNYYLKLRPKTGEKSSVFSLGFQLLRLKTATVNCKLSTKKQPDNH